MEDLCSQLEDLLIKSKANKLLEPLNFKCMFVNNEDMLNRMTDKILLEAKNDSFALNVDFEGVNLSRDGRICLGQFHISGSSLVYVVDFVDLDPLKAADGKLTKILESGQIQKIFFDPRNDSDALANLHNVHMKNVLCLQVSEVAFRKFNRRLKTNFVFGLQRTMDEHILTLDSPRKNVLMKIKAKGKQLFCPEFGGSYQVFVDRPLSDDLLAYSAVDVFFMDQLKNMLYDSLGVNIQVKVRRISEERLNEHKNPGYQPKGREKAICPSFK
jgi:exonuclease 3'-5' domain-containing protein 1